MLNVLLEAGAELNGAALQAGIVDKLILFYAPKIMGAGGVPLAQIPSRWFPKSPALRNLTLIEYGPDFAVEGYFHDVGKRHRQSACAPKKDVPRLITGTQNKCYGNHRTRRKN